MVSRRNVILFSTSFWDAPHWFRRQHFASNLARRGWQVMYVEPLHSITTLFREHGFDALRRERRGGTLRTLEDAPGVTVYRAAPALPFHVRSPIMARRSRVRLAPRIHEDAENLFGTDRYVQVVYHPADVYLTNPVRPLLYEIVDKFAAYPEYRRQKRWIDGCHAKLLRQAGAVSATTEELAPRRTGSRRSVVIPNGVDLRHYRLSRQDPEPDDLADIPHPRAVYVGALYQWFDFDLLEQIARRFPPVHFVLIGFNRSPLPQLPHNVHYLGVKPRQELPAYLQQCDVGIIPFKIDELTRHVDPLKFYEYMAADIPAVSTFMHALEKHRHPGVLSLSEDTEAFAAGLQEMLRTARFGRAFRRVIAQQHAWRGLAERFESELERLAARV